MIDVHIDFELWISLGVWVAINLDFRQVKALQTVFDQIIVTLFLFHNGIELAFFTFELIFCARMCCEFNFCVILALRSDDSPYIDIIVDVEILSSFISVEWVVQSDRDLEARLLSKDVLWIKVILQIGACDLCAFIVVQHQ